MESRSEPLLCALFGENSGLLASDAAKDDDVSHGVAAQAVGAMDAAGHLTRRVQAFTAISRSSSLIEVLPPPPCT